MGSPRNLKRSFESILQYHRNKGIRAKHFMKRPVPIVALQLIKTTNMYSHVECGRNKDRVQETILLHFYNEVICKTHNHDYFQTEDIFFHHVLKLFS